MTKARSVVTAIAIFLAFSSVVVVLWLGARDVIEQRMSAGALLQFLLYAVLGASALGQLSEVWNEVSQAAGAAARIGELLATNPSIVAPPTPARLPAPVRGAVRFDRVTFAYPTRREEPVLRGVDFSRRAGRDGRHRRPLGRGQVDAVPAHRAFLRPGRGRRPARRRRHLDARPQGAAGGNRARAAGAVHFRRDGRRQHRLRPPRRLAVRDRSGGGARRGARLRRGAAAGLRHAARRAWRDAVRRRAPAPRHRPRDLEGRPRAAARRGDLGAGRRQRDAGAGGARRADEGPHDAGHRASSGDDRRREPDPRARRRRDRRTGRSRDAAGGGRPLRAAGALAVRDRRGGAARRAGAAGTRASRALLRTRRSQLNGAAACALCAWPSAGLFARAGTPAVPGAATRRAERCRRRRAQIITTTLPIALRSAIQEIAAPACSSENVFDTRGRIAPFS